MIRGLLSGLFILLAAAATSPVIFGQLALIEFEAFVRSYEDSAPSGVRLELVSYSRGFLTSDAASRLSLGDRFDTQLMVEHKIHHGPIARDGALIRARVDSQVWPLDSAERRKLDRPIALVVLEDPLFQANVHMTLTGYGFQNDDNGFGWEAFSGRFSIGRETQIGSGEFKFGGFHVDEDGIQVVLGPISGEADFDAKQRENSMTRMVLEMERFEVRALGQEVAMGPFAISMEQLPEGPLIGQTWSVETGETQLPDSVIGPFKFESEAHNLEPKALAKLQQLHRDSQADSKESADAAARLTDSKEFQEAMSELARHSPWMQISEFEVQAADGRLQMKAVAKIDGELFEEIGEAAGLARATTVNVEIRFTEALFDNLIDATKKGVPQVASADPKALLEALIEAGILRRNAGELVLRVDYIQGTTELNSRPFTKSQVEQALTAAVLGQLSGEKPTLRAKKVKSAREPTSIRSLPAGPGGPASPANRELDEMRRQMGL